MRVFWGLLALSSFWSATASAQSTERALLLHAPSLNPRVLRIEQDVKRSLEASLTARNIALVPQAEANSPCTSVDCADDINRILGTSFAILFEVQSTGSRATMVSVALVGLSSDHSVGGQAEVATGRDGLPRAAERAFAMAFDRWQADQQGHLVFESNPTGAFIELDGQTLGRTPLRRLAQAGVHRVRATFELENGQVDTQSRDVTLDRHEEETLSFVPTAVAGPIEDVITQPVTRPETQSDLRWVNWVVGGALVAGGAALLVSPIMTLAQSGECTASSAFGCTERVSFDAGQGAMLGLGAGLLATGTILLIFQPWGLPTEAPPQNASVRLDVAPNGLRLSGTF